MSVCMKRKEVRPTYVAKLILTYRKGNNIFHPSFSVLQWQMWFLQPSRKSKLWKWKYSTSHCVFVMKKVINARQDKKIKMHMRIKAYFLEPLISIWNWGHTKSFLRRHVIFIRMQIESIFTRKVSSFTSDFYKKRLK